MLYLFILMTFFQNIWTNQFMELCDGTRVHKIPATDLTETIVCSQDAPSLIGFCLASHQCTFPQPPGITKYWLQNDTCFVINLLQSDYTIESSKTRRWDLIERFLMYIGTSSTIMKIFFNHRKDVTSPLDLLYSFICLYKDEEENYIIKSVPIAPFSKRRRWHYARYCFEVFVYVCRP